MTDTSTSHDVVDHVLIGVRNLTVASARMFEEQGLAALPGGSPAPGMTNAVIPLQPPHYLELITVDDAAASHQAAALAQRLRDSEGPYTWAIDPADLDAVAARLQLQPWTSGGPWRLAGDVVAERPFFIEYPDDRRSRTKGWEVTLARAPHRRRPRGFTFLELGGDETTARNWIGTVDVPLRFVGGPPRLAGIGIGTDQGEIVLR